MNCSETAQLIHAYIDKELDAANTLQVENHLEECPGCRQLLAEYSNMRNSIKSSSLRQKAPASLRDRVNKDLTAKPEMTPQVDSNRNKKRYITYISAIAANFIIGFFLVSAFFDHRAETRLISSILSDHSSAISANRLTDVESDHSKGLISWFTSKLDYSPRIYNFDSEGFKLLGGRLDTIQDKRIASITYQHNDHIINVYTWPSPEVDDAEQELHHSQGYQLVYWCQNRMNYWIVSDLNQADTRRFASILQQRLK